MSITTNEWWSVAQGLPSPFVVALCEAVDGTLWLGTYGHGLSRFDGKTFKNYTTHDGLLSNQVRALALDSSGALWIGTIGGGLNRLKDGQFIALSRTNGLPHDSVRALLPEADGSLWIGTGRGLCLLRGGRLFAFEAARELADAAIAVILDDGLGFLWCGSNRGVVRVARADLHALAAGQAKRIGCTTFGKSDGLSSPQISVGQRAGLRAQDGRLWFATVNGLNVVDPKEFRPNHLPPPVVIEEVAIDSHPVADFSRQETISVPPGPRRLELRYTGLSLAVPERVQFRRKLEGFDLDWQDVGFERVASYSGLPPGRYRFRVIAANNDGLWNTEGASLAFMVQPAPWQTWWMRSLAVVSGAGVIAFGVLRRMQRLQERSRAQQALARGLIESQELERARIARELHDSLGQNLIMLKNALHLAGEASHDPAAARKQFDELTQLAGKAIEEVRTISHALRPAELDSVGLTAAIEQLARRVTETTPVRMTLETAKLDGVFPSEFEIHFYRAVQEGITNILKHAQATTARLEIRLEPAMLRAVLRDNGDGFDATQMGRRAGMGLAGIGERMRLMGGQLEVESRPGSGTALKMSIPLRPRTR